MSFNHIDSSFSINPHSFFAKPALNHPSAGNVLDELKMLQAQIDQIHAINNQIHHYHDSIQSVNTSPQKLKSEMHQLMEDFLNLDNETRAKLAKKLLNTREKVQKFLKSGSPHALKKAHKSVRKLRGKVKKKLQAGHIRKAVNPGNGKMITTIVDNLQRPSLSRTPITQLTKAGLGLGI